jgi:hypothetical protein
MKIALGLLAAVGIAGAGFAAPAHADGNTANLDQLVGQAYTQFQTRCTPSMSPSFQRVAWDSPPTGQGGTGRIVDANPALGGPVQVLWNLGNGPYPGAQKIVPAQPQGYWDIVFQFC